MKKTSRSQAPRPSTAYLTRQLGRAPTVKLDQVPRATMARLAAFEWTERWLQEHATRVPTGPDMGPVGVSPDLQAEWRRHVLATGCDPTDLTLYGRWLFAVHDLIMWPQLNCPPAWWQLKPGVQVPPWLAETVNFVHRGPIIPMAEG